MKTLIKIDRFYYIFSLVLIALAVLVILSMRGIFSALSLAGQIDDSLLQVNIPRVDKTKIDQAIGAIEEPVTEPLDLGI